MLPLQLKSAATDGDVERLQKQLLKVPARSKDEEGNTPLHYAAWGGAIDLCRMLLDQKALLDAKNDDGQTPLHLAARQGRFETAEFLLKMGADIFSVDRIKYTPLHMAAEANWGVTGWEGSGGKSHPRNAAVCKLLLEKGADPLALDSFQRNPFDVASSDEEIRAILRVAIQQKKRLKEEANRKAMLQGRTPNSGTPSSSLPTAPSESMGFELKNPADWDRGDVGNWLSSLGLGQYAGIFSEKTINGKFLVNKMTEEKLKLLVSDEFHRDRILDEIEALKNFDEGELAARRRELEAREKRSQEELERKMEEERRDRQERRERELRALRSIESSVPTRITFENNTPNDIKVLWVDHSGDPQLRKFLGPSETHSEESFQGHVWQLVDDKTGNILKAEVATAEPLWVSAVDDDLSAGRDADGLPSYDQVANGGRF